MKTALVALLLLAAAPALAQTGGVQVCVFDDAGRPLPAATATLSNTMQLSPKVALLTGQDGCALFPVLRAGSGYVVEVSMPGFRATRFDGLRVPSGQTVSQHLVLLPEITERVEVSGRAPLVDLDRTEGSTRFDDAFIEHLPIPGRFYQNILTLAPGVLDDDNDGNPNVHGSRERDFRAVVDGMANTDPLTGEWLSLLNSDSIEEMEVVATGAGVEFGRASGGFARIVQKQGSNEFEGMASVILRSSKLDGGSAGDLLNTPEGADFESFQPAFQLSGPIVADRLWYRVSHEWIDREDPIDTTHGLVTTRRRQSISSDQLTWQASPRNKLSFSYQADPTEIEYFGVASRVPPDSSQRVERDGPTYKLNWTAPLSQRLLVDTTVGYQDLERGFFPMAENVPNDCAIFGGFFGPDPAILNTSRCFNSATGAYSGGHNETWEDSRQRLTVSTQATWFTDKIFGVSHRFKLGLTSENERFHRRLYRAPSIVFEIEKGFLFNPDIGYSYVRVSAPPEGNDSATGNNWALYVEDQFKPVSNLVLTVGLRYDREELFSQGNGVLHPAEEAASFEHALLPPVAGTNISKLLARTFTAHPNVQQLQKDVAAALGVGPGNVPLSPLAVQSAFWVQRRPLDTIEIDNNNLSPRFALAWDPWSDGKTKFSLTAGRYYDKLFLAIPLIELEPPVAELEYRSIQDDGRGRFYNFGSLALSPSLAIQTVDRELRTPYQDELTVNFEREIARETMLRASYIRRSFRDQLQDLDINHVTADKGRCVKNLRLGQPVVAVSLSEGHELVDPFSGETYIDTDPGPGDGRIDDCTGAVRRMGGLFGVDVAQPDGLPDLYVLNPAWTEILEVGNHNSTDYEAFVLELVRRLHRNWQMAASYTWSEAVGNAEDFDQLLGNERNLFEQERGYLAFDQTHVVKVNAMTSARAGWKLGGSLRWESGLPFSTLESRATLWSIPPLYQSFGTESREFRFRYPTGRRNDERNPSFWTLDLLVAKEIQLSADVRLRATLEVFNALDDKTLTEATVVDGTLTSNRRFGRQFQLGLRVGF